MDRGRNAVNNLSGAILGALNEPRNVAKGSWLEMSWKELDDKLTEEYEELRAVLWLASQGKVDGLHGVLAEAPDVGAVAAFCFDKAMSELAAILDKAG